MKRYKYTFVEKHTPDAPLRELDKLGAEGWELVLHVQTESCYRYFLKRELPEPVRKWPKLEVDCV